MKHKHNLLCAVIILVFQLSTSGQQQDARIPKVVPPSPNAAAIQRYGDIPVTAYTGVPNISIPIYEIKSGDISVPVSLSYNASGIRVADEASRVGLGWVLNAGGLISRTVVGGDDFEFQTYSYNHQTNFEIPKAPRFDQGPHFNVINGCDVTLNGYGINYTIAPNIFTDGGNYDLQPDQYSYNFGGHSGKFVLRRNREVVLNNVEKIKIVVVGANADSWEIKTPDGFQYKFELAETYMDFGGSGNTHRSSWYLTKIISPLGRTVEFVYQPINSYVRSIGSFFESKPGANLATTTSAATSTNEFSELSAPVNGKWYSGQYLSRIVFDGGEVQFNYVPGRLDVLNDVQLADIKVLAKKAGDNDQVIKKWTFNYSYFEGTNTNGGINPDVNANQLSKRLKLTSVRESSGTTFLPPYQFYYNNEADNANTLPTKLSFARDHWGYYNGKNNISLIPTFIGGCHTNAIAFVLGVMGSERDPDPAYNQLFMLNKIKYPTAGFTTFEYETHDYDHSNSVINDHSYFATYQGTKPATAQVNFSGIQAGGTFTGTLDLSGMVTCGQEVRLIASFIKLSGLSPGNNITYSLKNSAGIQVGGGYVDSYLGSTAPPMTEYLGTQQTNSGLRMTLKKLLPPDLYTWSIVVPPGLNLNGSNVYVDYSKNQTFDPISNSGDIVHNALFGGGLRVKRIADYSDANMIAKVKRYTYHYTLNGKVYSYGRNMSKPNYSYFNEQTGEAYYNPTTAVTIVPTSNVLIRESDSNIPLNGSAGGSNVGYDQVEELNGENGENGKTIYEYQNQPDVVFNYSQESQVYDQITTIPRKPPFGGIVAYAGNGNLVRQRDYALKDGAYVVVKELTNNYSDMVPSASNSAVLGIEKRKNAGYNPFVMLNCYITNYVYPAMTENRPVLVSSVSKLYDIYTGTAPVIVKNEFTYDNSNHLQLTSRSEYKSNGDKIITNFKYPGDFANAQCDAALLEMKGNSFMHAIPVTQQVILAKGADQNLVDAQINKFQFSNGKILLKEKAVLENLQPVNVNNPALLYNPATGIYPPGFLARVYFDNYDAMGNLTQAHKSGDLNMSYIWDYHAMYPVAEITNSSLSDCAFTSFEADGKGNWSFSGQPSNDANAFSGKRSYTLNVSTTISKGNLDPSKTYVVTYWSRSGSALINGSGTQPGITRKGWIYYEHVLPSGTSNVSITGNAAIDELRLFPKGSLMTTFTYEPLVGMTSQCDPNNRVNYYEYDAMQRLQLVRDQDGNIVKTIAYNYKQ